MKNKLQKRESLLGYLFLIPSLIAFAVFMFYPMADTIYLSFFDWNLVKPTKTFVGLSNYVRLFTDPNTLKILKNTMLYIVILLVLNLIIPYVLSFILSVIIKKGKGFYKAVFFLPSVISLVVGSILYTWILNPVSGPVAIIAVLSLHYYAYAYLLVSAALNSINSELEEMGEIQGAGKATILRKITFPLAAPGIVSTSVFAFINAWNDYMIAHTFMKDQSKYTLPVWLSSFSTPTMGTDFGGQMAASVTFSLPVVVFFMLIQRNIMKGVTTGAVK